MAKHCPRSPQAFILPERETDQPGLVGIDGFVDKRRRQIVVVGAQVDAGSASSVRVGRRLGRVERQRDDRGSEDVAHVRD